MPTNFIPQMHFFCANSGLILQILDLKSLNFNSPFIKKNLICNKLRHCPSLHQFLDSACQLYMQDINWFPGNWVLIGQLGIFTKLNTSCQF